MRNTRGPKKNTSRGAARQQKPAGARKTAYKKPVGKTEGDESREEKPFSKKAPVRRTTSTARTGYGKTSSSSSSSSSFKKDRFEKKEGFEKETGPRKSFSKTSSGTSRPGSKFSSKEKPAFKKTDADREDKKKRPVKSMEKPATEFKRKAKPLYKKDDDTERGFTKRTGSGKEKSYNLDSGKPFKPAYQKKTEDGAETTRAPKKKVYKKEFVQWEKPSKKYRKLAEENAPKDGKVRLNKFIANAGICSRREADTLIETGVITVNGKVITELGYKVGPEDKVVFGDKPVRGEKAVYILLNKPKDHITSSKDPQNRRTVLDLISGVKERVFPVGRLDRNTTGVLLLTNDGELAEKLVHPRKSVTKMYHAELDKKFTAADMDRIKKGVELLDGFFQPDVVEYVDGLDKKHIGLEIHSGKNRIVRRLFEALGYEVIKLDRIIFAGLTKKGLTRGKWRFLKEQEVQALKML